MVALSVPSSFGVVTTPLQIVAAEPILNEHGEILEGHAGMDPSHRPLVQILWAHDGVIYPPDIHGNPHHNNPPVEGGILSIGHLISPALDRPGRFAATLANPRPLSGRLFVRVFNAPTLAQARYYGDSQIMTIAGNAPLYAHISATDQMLDPDADDVAILQVTADPQIKTYGEIDSEWTWRITAGVLADGDVITGELDRMPGEAAGVYPILQGTLAAGTNYTLEFVASELTIEPAVLELAGLTASDKVYDGDPAATLADPGALAGIRAGDDVLLDRSAGAAQFADPYVGQDKPVTVTGLALSGADAANYVIPDPVTQASIVPRDLTVDGLRAANKMFNGYTLASILEFGVLGGVLDGDDVELDVTGATGQFDSAQPGRNKTVTVSGLALTGADAGQYSIGDPTTTATIFPWLHDLADYRQAGEVWSKDDVNALAHHPIRTHGNPGVSLSSLLHHEGATADGGAMPLDPGTLNAEWTGTDAYVADGWILNRSAAAEAKDVHLRIESTGAPESRVEDLLFMGAPAMLDLIHQPDRSRARLKQVVSVGMNLDGEIMVIDPTEPPTTGAIRLQDARAGLHADARIDRVLYAFGAPATLLQGYATGPVEMQLVDPGDRVTGFDPEHPEDAEGFLGRRMEIPESGYHIEGVPTAQVSAGVRSFYVLNPVTGIYSLWALGMERGSYQLSLRASDGGGQGQSGAYAGLIEAGDVHEFLLDYDSERIPDPIRILRPVSIKFQAPIQGDAENEVHGKGPIPVHVVAWWGGEAAHDVTPEIRLVRGDYRDDDLSDEEEIIPETSNPTTEPGVMRRVGAENRYQYLLKTKNLDGNARYTLIVRVRDDYGIVLGEALAVLITR